MVESKMVSTFGELLFIIIIISFVLSYRIVSLVTVGKLHNYKAYNLFLQIM